MHLIQVGRWTANLDFLIEADELDDPPGVVRVTFAPGRTRDLHGEQARQFLGQLGRLVVAQGESCQPLSGGQDLLKPSADDSQQQPG